MSAYLVEIFNEEDKPVDISFCGADPKTAEQHQACFDDETRKEAIGVWGCQKCATNPTKCIEAKYPESIMRAEEISRSVYWFTEGKRFSLDEKVPIFPLCLWEGFSLPIMQEITERIGAKQLDPSIVLRESDPELIRDAIICYSRYRNHADAKKREIQQKKREAERRATQNARLSIIE